MIEPQRVSSLGCGLFGGLVAFLVLGIAWGDIRFSLGVAGVAGTACAYLAKRVPIWGAPSAVISGKNFAEAERYAGVPYGIDLSLLRDAKISRRDKLSFGWIPVLLAFALLPSVWMLLALVLVPVGYVAYEVCGARRVAQLRDDRVDVVGTELVSWSSHGEERARIDLERPFTYEYVYKDECAAVYRLRQADAVLDFSSENADAPWLAKDLLKVEWPPVNRGARSFGV